MTEHLDYPVMSVPEPPDYQGFVRPDILARMRHTNAFTFEPLLVQLSQDIIDLTREVRELCRAMTDARPVPPPGDSRPTPPPNIRGNKV
jgi:hypothetical protein